MFLATAYYGQLSITTVIYADDINTATSDALRAFGEADLVVVEDC